MAILQGERTTRSPAFGTSMHVATLICPSTRSCWAAKAENHMDRRLGAYLLIGSAQRLAINRNPIRGRKSSK
jgi:hypothetical protein